MSKTELYAALNRDFQSLMAGGPAFWPRWRIPARYCSNVLPKIELGGILSPRRRYAGVGAVSGANRLCVRIPVGGRGVCGAVARIRFNVLMMFMRFDGHIACDAASNAEIVLPVTVGERIIGVLDMESSTAFGRFTEKMNTTRTLVAA